MSETTSARRMVEHQLFEPRELVERVDPFNERVVYQDEKVPSTDIYVGSHVGKIYEISGTTDDGTTISCSVRTGSKDFDMPQTMKEYGNAIFDVDPNGGDITVTPYLNAETSTLSATTLSGTGRQKIPFTLVDTYAYSMAFDLSWSGTKTVYQYEYLWRPDEELIKHWEFPPTSHGMQGWQHVRDMYVAIRSTADVTLTVVIDGNSNTYNVPSTSGERRKVHLTQLNRVVDRIGPLTGGLGEGGLQLKRIDMLVLLPSRDLSEIAREHVAALPRQLRVLLRTMGALNKGGGQLMSYLLFQDTYTRELIALGYQDAMKRAEDLVSFLGGFAVESTGTTGILRRLGLRQEKRAEAQQ